MSETIIHCNVKENADLIARILDYDVEGKSFESELINRELAYDPAPLQDDEGYMADGVCVCKCGALLEAENNFCADCGQRLKW